MSGLCDGCGEMCTSVEGVEVSGRVYFLCFDCCRKIRGIIEGDVL